MATSWCNSVRRYRSSLEHILTRNTQKPFAEEDYTQFTLGLNFQGSLLWNHSRVRYHSNKVR